MFMRSAILFDDPKEHMRMLVDSDERQKYKPESVQNFVRPPTVRYEHPVSDRSLGLGQWSGEHSDAVSFKFIFLNVMAIRG